MEYTSIITFKQMHFCLVITNHIMQNAFATLQPQTRFAYITAVRPHEMIKVVISHAA